MRKALSLAALALTSACHFAPRHEPVPMPTPPVYLAATDSDAALGVRATEVAWREFFRDPRLDTLIATALRSNRDMVIAVEQIEVARGQYRIQRSDRLPAPVASGSATRSGAGEAATGIAGRSATTDAMLSPYPGPVGVDPRS